jgi:hypothetical protein
VSQAAAHVTGGGGARSLLAFCDQLGSGAVAATEDLARVAVAALDSTHVGDAGRAAVVRTIGRLLELVHYDLLIKGGLAAGLMGLLHGWAEGAAGRSGSPGHDLAQAPGEALHLVPQRCCSAGAARRRGTGRGRWRPTACCSFCATSRCGGHWWRTTSRRCC